MTKRDPVFITKIFYDGYSRLRSGWRFFLFLSLFLVVGVVVNGFLQTLLNALPLGFSPDSMISRVGGSIVGLFMAIGLGWLCVRFLEDLPFRALGAAFSKSWLKDFIVGNLVGILSFSGAILIAVVFGGLRFEFNAAAGSSAMLLTLAATFLIFAFGAAFEEALFRGYMFQTFLRSNLGWVGWILTSFLFASGHIGNENAAVFSFVNTVLAGLWLGIGYFKTRTLWFAFGLHLSWNWVQGSIFGVEVSGFTDFATAPVFLEIDKGPAFVTGGEYGIEGGLACTAALLISSLVIWYLPYLKASDEMLALTSPTQDKSEEMA